MASSRMIALLGLLAVAGYQNREKLGELLGRVTGQPGDRSANGGSANNAGGLGGLLGNLGGIFSTQRDGISGGLGDLIDRFTNNGQGEAAKSWVSTGANRDLSSTQLEEALGEDTIGSLIQQTGLSRQDLISRLQTVLPAAVDKLTPDGRLPTTEETTRWIGAAQPG